MKVDDLMAVWRLQDAAPLHGVNETLLRLALREEEAKVQRSRRVWGWVTYGITASIVVGMARRLYIMINHDDAVLSGWDYALPVIGAAAALLWVRMMYRRQLAQVAREQRFGDSLRDQISRQLAQLDYGATMANAASLLGTVFLPIVSAFSIILASWRINGRSFSDPWLSLPIVFMIGWCILMVGGGLWWTRRYVTREVLPRKRQWETLLKDLEGA